MRSLRRVLLWASAAGIWIGCSVNHAGLSDGGGLQQDGAAGHAGTSGSGGSAAAGRGGASGRGGAAGSLVTGSAGSAGGAATGGVVGSAGSNGGGGVGPGGGAGSVVTGSAGSAGMAGAGGDAGTGGVAGGTGGTVDPAGTGGSGDTGGAGDTSGTGGTGGAGDTAGAGGTTDTGGTSGTAGMGGSAGTIGGSGGAGGIAGTGGRGGNGGRGGAGGRGGTGGNPCLGYPFGTKAFVTPTDGRVHCYWARNTAQTWSDAQQSCTQQNGHLVTILSAEENAFVVSMAVFSTAFSDTWIGATDGKTGGDKTGAGMYHWVTNEPWGYTSWAQGQPDGFCDPCSTGQVCTCDHRATLVNDGTWTDRWQDNARSSVCEATPP